jgi:uncharacterized membrane protein YkvA (DUF1232 family)
MGDKVEFAKDFSLYLTYRHRKSSIAGGDIEEMDFDEEVPNTGFMSNYREVDGRIPTPAIEIGANTNRYRHLGLVNVPRTTSEYGHEMRSLFGCGDGFVQLGFDFSGLENRIMGHYVTPYPDGEQLAASMVAEKPFDSHTLLGQKLGIPRTEAKSVAYACLYGAQPTKIATMLGKDLEYGKKIFNGYWDAVPALKALKERVEDFWEGKNQEYLISIDRRKINTRSKHSLLNTLFQSAGVIVAKYSTVFMLGKLEKMGYCISPFDGKPDVISMIEYHDEAQLAVNPKLLSFKTFDTEEEAQVFVNENKIENYSISTISHGKKYYVCIPNDVSKAIEDGVKQASELLKLNVPLGIEWVVGKNWSQCH